MSKILSAPFYPKISYPENGEPEIKPKLVVVIDTEEEFDWSQPFSRANNTVKAMQAVHRIQEVFDAYGVIPTYVIDYPVASQPEGFKPLQEIHAEGRCLIGTHLHPWVTPPFEEEVNTHNSFPGNLPPALEAEKMRIVGDCIGEQFGHAPIIYKAGRYGFGSQTAAILEAQGYEVDLSVCPHMDYSSEGGPNYMTYSARPFWFGTKRRMFALPLTVGFSGPLRPWGRTLHPIASQPPFASLHAVGILSRLQLLEKIWLSPEGYLLDEHIRLIRALFADGLRVFSFAFHSPSAEPGHTPYVRSEADLETFLSQCRRFFDFFMGELGGLPSTPLELKTQFAETHCLAQLEAL